jgi:hypothetical protein
MADPQVHLTNGVGTADHIDLAVTKVTPAPPIGEIGSAYDRDRIFTRFDDGRYFETRDIWTQNFDDMLRMDGKARTLEQVLCLPLMSAEHSIEPAKGDSGEAEFVIDALTRPANAGGMTTPLELVIGQMTSGCIFRRAFFEKVFTVEEGRVRYAKLAFRPASTCYLLRDKTDYSFKGIKQRFLADGDVKEVTIPPQKSFVYLHNQHRNPLDGTSDLETAWHIFESKQKIRFLWYSFLENQAMQKMIFHHTTNDPNELTEQAKRAATLKGGGVLAVGPDQDAKAYPGGDGEEFKNAIAYLDGEMAGSVLAGFTELPSAAQLGRGSYALAESATDFFLQSRMATLTEMGESLTSWVVADLVQYNFGAGAAVPTFTFKPPAQDSTEKAIEMLQALATTAQPTSIPHEFIDLLTEKVAGYFNIDVSQVHDAITKQQQNAPKTPQGQLMAGVDAATALARQAGFADQAATA